MIRRPLSLALLLAVLSFCAAGELKDGDSVPPTVTVYTVFEEDYSAFAIEEMKTEFAAIIEPAGLQLEWRLLDGRGANEISAELVVVTFKGKCQVTTDLPAHGDTGALGWTHMSDGELLPFSDVQCDRIRKLITPQLVAANEDDRDSILGRAIARVLAHEFYHMLMKTKGHSGCGIAKAYFTTGELTSDAFVFEERELKALRGRKKLQAPPRGSRPAHSSFSGGGR
jgi:hypothetical protein